MDITNPEAIRFVNLQIRPLCEAMRELKIRMVDMKNTWDNHVGALIPNDASPLDDGREAEGISRLTGADVNNARNTMASLIAGISDAVVGKPCIRTIGRLSP